MKLYSKLSAYFRMNRRRRTCSSRMAPEALEVRSLLSPLIKGGIVSGTIGSAEEVDTWTFTGVKGDRIELISTRVAGQAGFSAFAEVFNSSEKRIASFWSGTNTVIDLPEPGTFSVKIRDDNRAQTGNYTIGMEGLKPISPNPVTLVKGGIATGSILTAVEKDQFTFSAKPGERYEIITTSTAKIAGFTAYTEVFAPSGNRIAHFWPGTNVVLHDFRETGSYMVQVRDDNYTQTGTYTIGLEGLKPISLNPVALVKGGIATGSILTAVEKDQFTFSAKPGERYEIITTSTAKIAGFTAYTEVFAPSGNRIAHFWPGTNVVLHDFRETGSYMVQVRDDNYTQTGTYTIGLEGLKPISPGPVALAKGGIATGSILTAVEKDQFTFSAKPGERYEIITTSTARIAGFTAYTEVFAPSGNRIAHFWPGTNVVLHDFRETGDYMVQVRDDNYTQTGTYTIGLEGLKPISPGPVALAKGGIATGSILTAAEKDQFTFSAKPGERYEIITTSTAKIAGFTAYTEVFAPSGNRIAHFWPGTNVVLHDFRETGSYMVQVRDDNYTQTGTYTIGLEGLKPVSPDAKVLASATTVSMSITAATQKDQWSMSVPVGKKLSITLSQTRIDSGFDVYADVYSSSGTRIGGLWSGTTTFTLPGPGVYLIQVRDGRQFFRGSYKLRAWLV
jgi:DUF971 family protein